MNCSNQKRMNICAIVATDIDQSVSKTSHDAIISDTEAVFLYCL